MTSRGGNAAQLPESSEKLKPDSPPVGAHWECWAPVHWTNDDHATGLSESKVSAKRYLETNSCVTSSKDWPWPSESDIRGNGFHPVDAVHEAVSQASCLTAKLLDPKSLHGPHAPLKRWFAWALEQHQEATQRHIERQHYELKNQLDEGLSKCIAALQVQAPSRRSSRVVSQGLGLLRPDGVLVAPEDATPRGEPSTSEPVKVTKSRNNHMAPACMGSRKPTLLTDVDAYDEQSPSETASVGDAEDDSPQAIESSFSITAQRTRASVRQSVKAAQEVMRPLQKNWAKQAIRRLNSVAILMVCLNSIFIYLQLDQQGMKIAVNMGYAAEVGWWSHLDIPFMVADHLFNAFFVVELVMKVYILRWTFMMDVMNIFDSVVVVINCVNLIILDGSSNAVLARLARIFKVMRVVRVSRVARASHELRVLLTTLFLSMRALIWSAVLLALIILISGLAMAQFVGMYLLEDCDDRENGVCDWAYKHYGGASRSAWTMFKVTLSGGWPQWANDLVTDISVIYVVFWVFYIVVVWFAVLRILTALFLKQTMEVASADQEMMIVEKLRLKSKFSDKLRNFFAEADADGDGFISHEEFMTALACPKAKAWLQTLEIETQEIEALFHMLDDGDGEISFDEFLGGAVRLKGAARSIDQVTIIHNQNKMLTRLEQLTEDLAMATRAPKRETERGYR